MCALPIFFKNQGKLVIVIEIRLYIRCVSPPLETNKRKKASESNRASAKEATSKVILGFNSLMIESNAAVLLHMGVILATFIYILPK